MPSPIPVTSRIPVNLFNLYLRKEHDIINIKATTTNDFSNSIKKLNNNNAPGIVYKTRGVY